MIPVDVDRDIVGLGGGLLPKAHFAPGWDN